MKRIAKAKGKFRSTFEHTINTQLVRKKRTLKFKSSYEKDYISYTIPRKYNPDFTITNKSGKVWYLEVKGYFRPTDRWKHRILAQQHPECDIRFVFMSNGKVGKTMRYSGWCEKYNIPYCFEEVPEEWFQE